MSFLNDRETVSVLVILLFKHKKKHLFPELHAYTNSKGCNVILHSETAVKAVRLHTLTFQFLLYAEAVLLQL